MALIKCSECGKEISDNSSVCISCGNPINRNYYANVNNSVSSNEMNNTNENVVNNNKLNGFSLTGFILGIVSFLFDVYGLVSFTGLIFSIVGLVNETNQKNKTFAIIGIILSGLELFFKFLQLINWLSLLNQI